MEQHRHLPATTIASLLKQEVKPIFLLGAGASVRSGIPLSGNLVEAIAKWGYCKTQDRDFYDPTVMRSDWWPWLTRLSWFRDDLPLADNYSRAVESVLKPQASRRDFFKLILNPEVPPSPGYTALARLLGRKVIKTVLTTNFDNLVASTARSIPDVHAIEEIKTPGDYQLISTNPQYPQVVYLHGSVDHYTDKNVEDETNNLNAPLIDLLRPLLRDHPLVVVGYRGAEPSIMRHLLIEQRVTCQNYRHGIFWCLLKSSTSVIRPPLLSELHATINGNLQFVEIEGFDELMTDLDATLPELILSSSSAAVNRKTYVPVAVHDLAVTSMGFDDLNETLLRSKLIAYAEAVRLPRLDLSSTSNLQKAAAEQSLAIYDEHVYKPTNGGLLLFASKPDVQLQQACVEVRLRGSTSWIAQVLEKPSMTSKEKEDVEETIFVKGDLWSQLEQAADLLARVNRPFRLKGPVSHDAYPYPPLALKELLTNLLAHRDYSNAQTSVITVSQGEIQFQNPGGLVEHVKKRLNDREMQSVISLNGQGVKGYRNPVIADFFFSAGAMDKEGSGLPDVLSEAANNLNEISFGPTDDNSTFVATIRCRPEALAIDPSTKTARATAGELRYSANLLTITRWPDRVWKMGTISEAKDFGSIDAVLGVPPFAVHKNWIWTFSDPNQDMAIELKDYALEEEIHNVSTDELLAPSGAGPAIPRLLNMALTNHLVALGLRPKHEGGRIRAYFPANGNERREITYRGLFKRATRTVARAITSRATGRVLYWEHKAVALRFERFGTIWGLALVPCYVFTSDGDSAPIPSEKIGPLSTRRASRDYNPSVLHDLVFWSRMIASSSESLFEIPLVPSIASSHSVVSDAPVIQLSASLPTVVFQEPIDASMATAVEVEMSEEEQRALEAEIAEAIEQSTEPENTDNVT